MSADSAIYIHIVDARAAAPRGKRMVGAWSVTFLSCLVLSALVDSWIPEFAQLSQSAFIGCVFAIAALLGCVAAFAVDRLVRSRQRNPELDPQTHKQVVIYLSEAESRSIPELSTESFEPLIFKCSFPITDARYSRFVTHFGGALILALLLFAAIVLLYYGRSLFVCFVGAPFPLFRSPALFWPTYLRVSPGLLEVLRGTALSFEAHVIWHVELAGHRATFHLHENTVRFDSIDGESEAALEIGLMQLHEPREAAWAIARAVLAGGSPGPTDPQALMG